MEDKWPTDYHVEEMLQYLGDSASQRKLRYFMVACARRVLPKSADNEMLIALEVAEKFADQSVSKRELSRVRQALKVRHTTRFAKHGPLYTDHIRSVPAWHATREQIVRGAAEGSGCCAWSSTRKSDQYGISMSYPRDELMAQANLVRDIFGNPFRPVTFDPRWRSSNVVGLAQAIYDDKAFERMPILADALMDAGCEDDEIIGHCRGPGPHVRGGWVVDLVLDKK
jgi:hypothetical protein